MEEKIKQIENLIQMTENWDIQQIMTLWLTLFKMLSIFHNQALSETLINIPGFNRLPAIQNGNVKELDPILFMQAPGPRIIDALEEMSSLLIE